MIVALLLQAATPMAAPPAPPATAASPAEPKLKPTDATTAVDTFKATCWTHFREPDDLRAAVPLVTIPLAEMPHQGASPSIVWRADEAVLIYSTTEQPGVPSRQCLLHTRLPGAADQLTLAARIATALGVAGGRTQTGRGAARTIWDVAQPDGRTTRLIATTANASGGQTDLRLQALLLTQK